MTEMERLPLANLDDDVEDAYEYHTTTKKLKVVRKSNWKMVCCGVLLFLCVVAILGLCVTLGFVVFELKDSNSQAVSSSESSSTLPHPSTTSSLSSPSPSPSTTVSPPTSSLCLTDSCVKLAGSVLSNMDTSVNPCKDFYNFSCGGWVKRNVLPEGYGRWSRFSELDQQNSILLRRVIENDLLENIPAILGHTRHLYYPAILVICTIRA